MNRDPRLERYLNTLESALKPFPVSDRAEIITEIKSHVLDALERDPNTNLETVLAAIGEPETVANKYLIERGLKLQKPSISPIVKWLIIGFLGTVAMVLIFTIVLFTHFSPVVSVNEKTESVSLFGGAIQVEGKESNDPRVEGSAGVAKGQPIAVFFGNGNFEVAPTEGDNFVWSCSGLKDKAVKAETLEQTLTFDLRAFAGSSCEISVPQGSQLTISGESGNLDILEPNFNVDASLQSGNVEFEADDISQYKFDVKAENGSAGTFTSSTEANAYAIKIFVRNGNIEN